VEPAGQGGGRGPKGGSRCWGGWGGGGGVVGANRVAKLYGGGLCRGEGKGGTDPQETRGVYIYLYRN